MARRPPLQSGLFWGLLIGAGAGCISLVAVAQELKPVPSAAPSAEPQSQVAADSGPSIDPGLWAGSAGLVVAVGGLLTNFMNAQGKISQLEMDRLRQLQDDLNAERDSLRASFERQIQVLQRQNHTLRDRFVKTEAERDNTRVNLEKQLRTLHTENRSLRDRVVKLEAQRANLRTSLEQKIQLLEEENHNLRDRVVKVESQFLSLRQAQAKQKSRLTPPPRARQAKS